MDPTESGDVGPALDAPTFDGDASLETVSCRVDNPLATSRFCLEFPDASPFEIIGFEAGCDGPDDSDRDGGLGIVTQFDRAPCSRDGAVSACRQMMSSGRPILTWWYDSDPGSLRAGCEREGGSWVEP